MTYAITIAEPGADPVSVSLEWTTEAPTVAGLYMCEISVSKIVLPVSVYLNYANVLMVGADERLSDYYQGFRWLGPIPLAPMQMVNKYPLDTQLENV